MDSAKAKGQRKGKSLRYRLEVKGEEDGGRNGKQGAVYYIIYLLCSRCCSGPGGKVEHKTLGTLERACI